MNENKKPELSVSENKLLYHLENMILYFVDFGTIIVTLVMAFRTLCYDISMVPSGSMIPTLNTSDMVIIEKIKPEKGYGVNDFLINLPVIGKKFTTNKIISNGNIQRGWIIVFSRTNYPNDQGQYFCKRVIGLPGDHIKHTNDDIIINGESISYDANGKLLYDEENYTLHKDDGTTEETILRTCKIATGKDRYIIFKRVLPKKRSDQEPIEHIVPPGHVYECGDDTPVSFDARYFYFRHTQISQICGRVVFVLFGSGSQIMDQDAGWWQFCLELGYRIFKYILNVQIGRLGRVYKYEYKNKSK